MSDERKKTGLASRVGIAVIIALLYVLSSGPMRTVALSSHVSHVGTSPVVATTTTNVGWHLIVYFPLYLIADQSWGSAIDWYWNLFPVIR